MKRLPLCLAATALLALFSGCRREDIREMTVSMPDLKESDKAKIVETLSKYSGIDKNSYKWDFNSRTLTLKYDSMKIAQANVRYAIDEKCTKVAFPEKKDNHAGY